MNLDVNIWKDKEVHIILTNGYFYVGKIKEVFKDFINFKDKNGRLITIRIDKITLIQDRKKETER
jgi:hypothetical protein